MLVQVVVTTLVALGVAPCMLQRVCRARAPRPPSAVCMHRMKINDKGVRFVSWSLCLLLTYHWISTTGHDSEDDVVRILPSDVYKTNDEYRHIWSSVHGDALVFVRPLLFVWLVVVLLQVPLQLPQDDMLTLLAVLLLHQVTTECKSFMPLGKAERAMFLSHSEACLEQSGAERSQVERLVGGAPEDSPALRRHVLCVLRRCKLLRKDGRLDKHALRDRVSGTNDTKILEGCTDQSGDTPEDLAWQLFRCGLNKKVLFEHMTAAAPNEP